jgi:hypothetical protein
MERAGYYDCKTFSPQDRMTKKAAYRGFLLLRQGSNRTERKEMIRWIILARCQTAGIAEP